MLAALSIAAAGLAVAQTSPPSQESTAPSSASSPHQRSATSSDSTEAPADNGANPASASTPHQQQATGSMSSGKGMKDCIAKEQAKDSAMSKDDAKKTCKSQMKANSGKSQ